MDPNVIAGELRPPIMSPPQSWGQTIKVQLHHTCAIYKYKYIYIYGCDHEAVHNLEHA